jgi:hypothetical protein
LTCNYVEKIIPPIVSRCQTYKIEPLSKKEVAVHLKMILESGQMLSTCIRHLGIDDSNLYKKFNPKKSNYSANGPTILLKPPIIKFLKKYKFRMPILELGKWFQQEVVYLKRHFYRLLSPTAGAR